MTRDELVSQAETFLGRDDKTTDVRTFLNWSLRSVAKMHLWTDLIDSTTGSFTASLGTGTWPGTASKILTFGLTGDYRRILERMPLSLAARLHPDTSEEAEGTTTHYLHLGLTTGYELIPIPDDTYPWKTFFYKIPDELTATGHTPDITNIDDILVYMTCMHESMALGLLEDAATYRAALFSEYPPGGRLRRGMIPQAIMHDKRSPDRIAVMREFNVYGDVRPPGWLAMPYIME